MAAEPAAVPTAAVAAKIRKFPCPACGADVEWSPGAAALECPYCGHRQQLPTTGEAIHERALEAGLRQPRDLGWGAERKTVRCTRCGATETLDPGIAATTCAFCGTPTVVDAPGDSRMVRPEGVLPFAVDLHAAAERFRSWIGGLWFRPNDLRQKASLTALRGVYVPFWTFDAATHSRWTAEAGHRYQAQGRSGSGSQFRTSTETRIRWEHAEGTLEKFFDDLPVPASRGVQPADTEGIEPFPTARLVAYDPRYLSGFLAEEYGVDLDRAWAFARQRMQSEIRSACAAAVPGDTHRNLEVETSWSGIAYKGALLPLWIAAYQYGSKTYRFLVNGVTGKVDGKAPFSVAKIVGAIAAVLLVIFLIAQLG